MKKVGIDTNVLLRLFVDDNPAQRKAVLEFGKRLGREYDGYVAVICLVEMDWALRKQYGYSKGESANALRKLSRVRGVEVQSFDAVERALDGVENEDGDFADLLIAHLCLDAGCDRIVSLDKKAATRIPVVELLT